MNLPLQRFTTPPGRDDDFDFDDDHGYSPVLEREVEVEGVDGGEYVVSLIRESIDDDWCADETNAPREIADEIKRKAEKVANRG